MLAIVGKGKTNAEAFTAIELLSKQHIDELLTITLRIKSEVKIMPESKPLGVITEYKQGISIKVNGKPYVYQGILPQSHSNPIELFQNLNGHQVLTKGGDNYTLMIEAIGHDLFARHGIPVPRMSLHTDEHGKTVVVMEYLAGYLGDIWNLEPRYRNDEKIQDALLLSALIKDTDRTPWNMMFRRHSFEFTEKDARFVENELMHIDFGGSMFSKAAGGFNPFPEGFYGWKSGSLREFITTVRHDMDSVVNKAYENALNDKVKMIKLAKKLSQIKDGDIDEIVRAAVKGIRLDSKDAALAEIDLWIAWCEIENRDGFWNRKSRKDRTGPIEMFKNIRRKIESDELTFAEFMANMLKSRRDDVLNKEFILRPALFENPNSPLHRTDAEENRYEYKWGETRTEDSNTKQYHFTIETYDSKGELVKKEEGCLEVTVQTDNEWIVVCRGIADGSEVMLEKTSYDNLGDVTIAIKSSSAGFKAIDVKAGFKTLDTNAGFKTLDTNAGFKAIDAKAGFKTIDTKSYLADYAYQQAGTTLDELLETQLSKAEAVDFVINYSYTPQGTEQIPQGLVGNIVYSDSLQQSEVLQYHIKQAQITGRKFFLVNKEQNQDLSFLKELGIDRSVFVHILHQNSHSSEDIAKIVAATLINHNIRQVRVFANTEDDLLAWSKQDLIEAFILLLTDKRFEIISDYSQQHTEYIRTHAQALIAA
jgi:hypothetical protein